MPDQGSSRRAYFATPTSAVPPIAEGDANPDTQATIITRAPVLAQYPLAGMHPRDLGRLLEGQRLGHFDLQEYVGGGGMGAVFKALDTMLNRIVAVKVLSQEQSGDEETLRRFQNEAQSAARLDHENISRVFYVGEDRGWHYIVFEFIEGANLRDVVHSEGPLSLARTVSYTLQIADALTHASQRDVVHRDIKPSNVIITPDGRAKLVDMGLARLHQVEPVANDLTASGVTLGTFDYISPEQARDPRSADVRSDIYSLGCTLYFMLTGRPPFPEGTVLQKLLQHQGDQPPDPRLFRPDLPEDLMKIMDTMLAKQPERRYATPEHLIAELTALAARYGLEAASSSRLVWPSPVELQYTFWERHLPWIAPLAALFLLVAILGFIWSRDDGLDTPPPIVPAAGAVEPADRDDSASTKGESKAASKSAELSTEPDGLPAQPQPDDRPSSQ
jgi:serine/threonine-protein kinase